MRINHAIAALGATAFLVVGILLVNEPGESGLGLDATAEAPQSGKRVIHEALMARPPARVAPAIAHPGATERGPASAPDPVSAKRFRTPFRSPLSVLETLFTTVTPAGSDGSSNRTQIVRARFKYPLIRIEETLSPAGDSVYRQEMVADHVLVQLQSGATRGDLEELLQRQSGFTAYVRFAARTPGLFLVAFDGTDPAAMGRVIRSLESESHVVAHSEPDLIVHAF